MRRVANVDANQPAIVEALRRVGCRVQHLHMIGQGCPDLLVGRAGELWLMEVKDGAKPPSKRALTKDEKVWHDLWDDVRKTGRLVVVESVGDALQAVGVMS
jgi:hypothetical protein